MKNKINNMPNKTNKFLLLIIFVLTIALIKTNWATIEYGYDLFQWKVLKNRNPDFTKLIKARTKAFEQFNAVAGLDKSTIESEKKKMIVFFKPEASEEQIYNITQTLLNTKKITNVKYVSQKEALAIYKKNNPDMLQEFLVAEIFPPSLDIMVKEIDDIVFVENLLKKYPEIDSISKQKDVFERFQKFFIDPR